VRPLLMTSTMLVALAAAPAFAELSPVTGQPEPTSTVASNRDPSNTRSEIAPALPAPPVEGPRDLLMAPSQDIGSRRSGAAQEALERAETRVLDRGVPPSMANAPDDSRVVDLITQARMGRWATTICNRPMPMCSRPCSRWTTMPR
jgi:hypothetical protein